MNKNYLYIAIGVVVVAVLAIWAFAALRPDTVTIGDQPANENAFSETGTLLKDNPGLKAGVWYVNYKPATSAAVTQELDISGIANQTMYSGQRAKVEGTKDGDVVRVSKLQILNAFKDDLIWVNSPLPNDTVSSPLTVSGRARGNWFFEASFPVTILDANGKVLGQAPAQAQSNWMVTDYVTFSLSLPFSTPTTATGTLVLEKDNPSGLPQNANELRIPVTFGTTAQQRSVKLYYYNQNNDKDASGNILCSAKGVVAVDRQIPVSNTPIQDTLALLIKGQLSQQEKSQGLSTEFPLAGLTLKGANLSNGTLSVEFADPQNKTSGGSCRVNILKAQIEATAKQFPGVTKVVIVPATVFQP